MNFKQELKIRTDEANRVIRSFLPIEEGYEQQLREAMNYSMLAGGKRLRPIMISLTYEMFGGKGKVAEPFMAAMEMIHTHSLVHDDLPAMDNDEYRRGKKTTHAVYGEAAAILAGDALLNYAYETAFEAFRAEPENPHTGEALMVLAKKTGIKGMMGGQSVDVRLDGQALDAPTLDYIYENKTGALIEASMMIGAILSGAPRSAVQTLEKTGSLIGRAFQIQDDILDITGDEALLGKPINSDEKNHKTTYVTIHGLEQSRRDVKDLTDQALQCLDLLQVECDFFRQLLVSLVDRNQ